ncbi:hypothetical protein EVAR_19633_1 [Eumeta japonica]|uniref:Uncharacterized protein n=1 Tax=Eumeta variegata TaxID=151549 RepID=A0A4C1UFD7_EUMVA|nr:hypothetical protein EVAR_19633_1 [Eumeta japonica]
MDTCNSIEVTSALSLLPASWLRIRNLMKEELIEGKWARRLGVRCCPFINLLGSHIFLNHIPASAGDHISKAPFLNVRILFQPLYLGIPPRELQSTHKALSR